MRWGGAAGRLGGRGAGPCLVGAWAQVPVSDWELWQPDQPSPWGPNLLLAVLALAAGAGLGALLARARRRRRPLRTAEPGDWARVEFQRLRRQPLGAMVPGSALDGLADVIRAELEARGHAQVSKLPLPELARHLPPQFHELLVRLEDGRFGSAAWTPEAWHQRVEAVGAWLMQPAVERSRP